MTNATKILKKIEKTSPNKLEFQTYLAKQNQKVKDLIINAFPFNAVNRDEAYDFEKDLFEEENIQEGYFLLKHRLKKYFNLDWLILGKK